MEMLQIHDAAAEALDVRRIYLGKQWYQSGRPNHCMGSGIKRLCTRVVLRYITSCTSCVTQVIEMTSVTPAADIWSVGCLAIELLTGQAPYFELQPMSALFRIVQDAHPPLPQGISPGMLVSRSLVLTASQSLIVTWLRKSPLIPCHVWDVDLHLSLTSSSCLMLLPSIENEVQLAALYPGQTMLVACDPVQNAT